MKHGKNARHMFHVYGWGTNIMMAYLRIRRPLILYGDPSSIFWQHYPEWIKTRKNVKFGSRLPRMVPGMKEDHLGICLAVGVPLNEIRSARLQLGSSDAVVQWVLQELNYDGLSYPNSWEDLGRRSWMILRPDQVWLLSGPVT